MRNTPQTLQVMKALKHLGHATNQDLFQTVSKTMPGITVTSIHRITSRLAEAGVIGLAPDRDGVTVLDSRPEVHDHFVCKGCVGMRDITLPPETLVAIQAQLPREIFNGGLTISGSCKGCAATHKN
jgi:Fe2+ or Zn2+ uptake regulation protein